MKPLVLLANKSESDQSQLQSMLDMMGFQLDIVDSAEVASERAMQAEADGKPYCLVLLDMDLPGQSTGNVSRNLRFSGYNRPILGIVNQLGQAEDFTARDGGCNDVICRPLSDRNTITKLQQYAESA